MPNETNATPGAIGEPHARRMQQRSRNRCAKTSAINWLARAVAWFCHAHAHMFIYAQFNSWRAHGKQQRAQRKSAISKTMSSVRDGRKTRGAVVARTAKSQNPPAISDGECDERRAAVREPLEFMRTKRDEPLREMNADERCRYGVLQERVRARVCLRYARKYAKSLCLKRPTAAREIRTARWRQNDKRKSASEGAARCQC